MIPYWLRLYPLQPLGLANPRLIPGRTLRGAVASTLRGNCLPGATHDHGPCNTHCQYWPVFGSNAPGSSIRIGNAYATSQDATQPVLTTARTCSIVPGFLAENGHGVVDTAIRNWSFEQASDDPTRRSGLLAPYDLRCGVCRAPLVACTGNIWQQAEHDWRTITVGIKTVSSLHRPTAIPQQADYFKQDGVLLDSNGYYVTRVDVPDGLDALLRLALGNGLIVGARRTRGQGLVRVEWVPRLTPGHPGQAMHERIVSFNRALRNEQRFYSAMNVPISAEDDGAWYFTLDVEHMQPHYDRQPDPLAEIKAFRAVRVARRWLRYSDENGRNTTTGLSAGRRLLLSGVFLCRAAPDADRTMLEQTLSYLETHGIGLGSERGYGSLTVCDPFHLELEPI